MALSIKDAEADRLARELARRSGETMTQAIITALRERLERVRAVGKPGLADEILEIGRQCAALPVKDPRSAEEILGYDENGLPN